MLRCCAGRCERRLTRVGRRDFAAPDTNPGIGPSCYGSLSVATTLTGSGGAVDHWDDNFVDLVRGVQVRFFRDLSVRGKLFSGFGAVLVIAVIVGVVLLSQMGNVNAGGVYLGTNAVPSVQTIGLVGTPLPATSARIS